MTIDPEARTLESGAARSGVSEDQGPQRGLDIERGDRIEARVVDVRDNGIFLEYGGLRGLVQVVELTWDERAPPRPERYAETGDRLEVLVLAVGPDRFGASLKRLDPSADPWRLANIRVGARHSSVVRSVREFGVFVNLDAGLVALLRACPPLEVGQRCEVELTHVDRSARKLEATLTDA